MCSARVGNRQQVFSLSFIMSESSTEGLPGWLDELLKPGVSSTVFTILKACLVGLVLTLCTMLAVLEDPVRTAAP